MIQDKAQTIVNNVTEVPLKLENRIKIQPKHELPSEISANTILNIANSMDYRLILHIATLALLAYCYWQTYVLGKRIKGGVIGRHWGAIRGIIFLIAVGNTLPFWINSVSQEAAYWIESIVLFVSALAALMAILFIQKLLKSVRS